MENISITTYRDYHSYRKYQYPANVRIYPGRCLSRQNPETPGSNGCRRHGESRPHEEATALLHHHGYLRQGKAGLQSGQVSDIITLDCDDMPAEKIPEFRQLVNDCPDTLGSFVSPRMHGLKIFVYLTGNEAEALRTELNALGTVDFTPSNAITTACTPWQAANMKSCSIPK